MLLLKGGMGSPIGDEGDCLIRQTRQFSKGTKKPRQCLGLKLVASGRMLSVFNQLKKTFSSIFVFWQVKDTYMMVYEADSPPIA